MTQTDQTARGSHVCSWSAPQPVLGVGKGLAASLPGLDSTVPLRMALGIGRRVRERARGCMIGVCVCV